MRKDLPAGCNRSAPARSVHQANCCRTTSPRYMSADPYASPALWRGRRCVSRPRLLVPSVADAEDDRRRLLAGLLESPARIEPKHLYDPQGSALYAAITRSPSTTRRASRRTSSPRIAT